MSAGTGLAPGQRWWVAFKDAKGITRQKRVICFELTGAEVIAHTVDEEGKERRAPASATLFFPADDV